MPRPISEATAFAHQHAASTGLHPKTILRRIRKGWTPQQATGAHERPAVKRGPKTQHSLTPEYAKRYHASRRAIAIANGICIECDTDKAAPGKTKCPGCLEINRLRYHQAKAA